jgi:hypothetical protein
MPSNDDHSPAPDTNRGAQDGQEGAETPRPEDQEGLTDFWDDILGPRPETVEARLIRDLGLPYKGVLTIATNSGRVIVKIDPTGRISYGEGYTPDDAAELFWTSLALKRPGMENRLRHLAIMEALLIRVGRADLNAERAVLAARAEGATEHTQQLAQMAHRNLEGLVGAVIEIGRGLASRHTAPSQADPAQDDHNWTTVPPPPAPRTTPAPGPPGSGGDPSCPECHGLGTVLGDCGESPNVWRDPCPTCMPVEELLPDVDPDHPAS